MFHTSENLAVLIDGHAMNALATSLNMRIDYNKLKKHFARSSKLSLIKYYSVVDANASDNPLLKLLDWLEYNGYRVHKKPMRKSPGDYPEKNVKESVIVALSVDLLNFASRLDHIVLVGTHGDYSYPVLQAQRLGARVTLLSSLKSEKTRPSDDLRRVVDEFIELDDLYDDIYFTETDYTTAVLR